jgi:hypothetical protein
MSLRWEEVVVDCTDFVELGHWWAEALGWTIIAEDAGELEIQNPDGSNPTMLFANVPEPKTVKNRLHLDLVPDDQQAEVDRLVALGAGRADIGQGETPWIVLTDPEGNEFCVLSAR